MQNDVIKEMGFLVSPVRVLTADKTESILGLVKIEMTWSNICLPHELLYLNRLYEPNMLL